MSQAKPWIGMPAPPGYVAGQGRGATGFTTRSDIGPAREAGEITDDRRRRPAHLLAQLSQQKKAESEADNKDEEHEDLNDANFDSEYGYSGSLFTKNTPYEADDREADNIYEAIDARMDERRKDRREKKEKEDLEKLRAERPKIQQQFSDLKRQLSSVSADEWDALPESSGARAVKRKAVKFDRFTPVPDSVLDSARLANSTVNQLDPRLGLATPNPGGLMTPVADLSTIGEARNSMLSIKLDQVSDSVSGQTVVDPKSFLTDLNSIMPKSNADISDTVKARQLLEKVCQTNPNHAPGWIAAARLEEIVGKLSAARALAAKGCELCPKSEDMWLEAARLQTPENAKRVVADAVSKGRCPYSVKLWVKAADLETEVKTKKRVLRKALDNIPSSVLLWKLAVELEQPEDAKTLLTRAVECCPKAVELWLGLARLQTSVSEARKVLNNARQQNETDTQIWFAAAKLEETHGSPQRVEKLIQNCFESLKDQGVKINRDTWMRDAEQIEKAGSPITAQAIVGTVIELDVESEDRMHTWSEDAKQFIIEGAFDCARAAYGRLGKYFPTHQNVWEAAAQMEKSYGTRESLIAVLEKAKENCPNSEIFWLMLAKEHWLSGSLANAQKTLQEAFTKLPHSEEIYLAAIKLESENDEGDPLKRIQRAQKLAEKARASTNTPRVWMKSAKLEWLVGHTGIALEQLNIAKEKFPDYPKLWMMLGQISEQLQQYKEAAQYYSEGTKKCPNSIPLWLLAARLQKKLGQITIARATLEKARTKNPHNASLWLAAIRIEFEAKTGTAHSMMATAMQECPGNGELWAEAIWMEDRPRRKAKSSDALKHCEHNPHVFVAVARLFWCERKEAKAREWFIRAVKADPHFGDAWANWFRFELLHGTEEQQQDVIAKCSSAEPNRGELWCAISKDVANWRATTADILKKVAVAVSIPV